MIGAGDIDADEVLDALANHPPLGLIFKTRAQLELLTLEADRRRIEVFLRERGYFAAEVGEPEIVPVLEERGEVELVFRVQLGPPAVIKQLEVRGAPEEVGVDRKALAELSQIEPGSAFRYVDYEAAKERLRERLFDRGYAHAKVGGDVAVVRATSEVAVTLEVDSGPLVRFGPAVLTGSTSLPKSSLLPRIAWSEGERFDPQRLALTRRRIEELSLAGSVSFDLLGGDRAELAPVAVNVEDALLNELRLGGGFGISDTSFDLRSRAMYLRRNFFHPLYTLRTEARPALSYLRDLKEIAPKIEAGIELIRDDFILPRLTATIGAAFAALSYELYKTLGPSAYVSFSRPLFDDRLFTGLRAEVDVLNIASDLTDADLANYGGYDPQSIAFLLPYISYDTRDDLLSARRGYYGRLELELGRAFSDASAGWVKATADVRGYIPLFTDRLIFAARVRGGTAFTQGGPLPLLRRYFAGGSESQRGFGRRQLAPDAVDEEGRRGPLGGETLLEGSMELRLDVVQLFGSWMSLVAFADAGDVTNTRAELDLLRLHFAAGPGLRYHTPIGPIRVDFGWRLNRTGEGEPQPDDRWALHFSLGEAF